MTADVHAIQRAMDEVTGDIEELISSLSDVLATKITLRAHLGESSIVPRSTAKVTREVPGLGYLHIHCSTRDPKRIRLLESIADHTVRALIRRAAELNLLHDAVVQLSAAEARSLQGSFTSSDEENTWRRALFSGIELAKSYLASLLSLNLLGTPFSVGDKTENIDLSAELLNLVETWRSTADNHGIELRPGIDELVEVRSNTRLLRQALNNLLSNAIKYSYAKGPRSDSRYVSIDCRFDDSNKQTIGISITNYGIAVDADERILDLGVRGRYASLEHPLGLGLGLTTAKNICDKIGGKLTLRTSILHDAEVVTIEGESMKTKAGLFTAKISIPTGKRRKD